MILPYVDALTQQHLFAVALRLTVPKSWWLLDQQLHSASNIIIVMEATVHLHFCLPSEQPKASINQEPIAGHETSVFGTRGCDQRVHTVKRLPDPQRPVNFTVPLKYSNDQVLHPRPYKTPPASVLAASRCRFWHSLRAWPGKINNKSVHNNPLVLKSLRAGSNLHCIVPVRYDVARKLPLRR